MARAVVLRRAKPPLSKYLTASVWPALLTAVLAVFASGACFTLIALRPELRAAAATHDGLLLADGVEKLIDEKRDNVRDRRAAYEEICRWPQKTAGYAYARAALAGRLAQVEGLAAPWLVQEMEKWTRRSIALDAHFRRGSARRMLGTLYVLAPASLVRHGDSEQGLELLEEQLEAYPNSLDNKLRLAEAYVALDDPEPAFPLVCSLLPQRAKLRADSRRLLDRLSEEIGQQELGCQGAAKPVH